MALDDSFLRRFPAPKHIETIMCNREFGPQAGPAPVHQNQHRVAFAASTPSIHHAEPPAASAPSVHRTHRVVEERIEMDEEAAAVTSSGTRATAASLGSGNRFVLVEEFLNVRSVSDPPSPDVEDAASEHSGVEGRLAQLEWEKNPLDQAVVTKQTMLQHAEHICKLERAMLALCELILEARPKEE